MKQLALTTGCAVWCLLIAAKLAGQLKQAALIEWVDLETFEPKQRLMPLTYWTLHRTQTMVVSSHVRPTCLMTTMRSCENNL